VQSPPIVVRNTVITPASISSYNVLKEQIPGWTRGWDARTGKLKWTFHTIPTPGEFGNETWKADSWSYTGKVSGWATYSADEELGYVYVPLNTAAPDYYGGHRLGDGLFAESLVCLDAETGRRVWHYQLVHHGLWDYDPPAAPNLHIKDRAAKAKRFSASLPWDRAERTLNLATTVTKLRGNHTLTIGGDLRKTRFFLLHVQDNGGPRGIFRFRGAQTAIPSDVNATNGDANAFAAFLLDAPQSLARDLITDIDPGGRHTTGRLAMGTLAASQKSSH